MRHPVIWPFGTEWAATIGIVLALVCFSTPTFGQAVRGVVHDSSTGNAVPSIQVTLLNLSGDTVATTRSGNDGSFLVSAPRWGRYVLSCIRLGYGPVTVADLKLLPDDTLQVALRIARLAIAMDPVVVKAEAAVQYADAQYLHHKGFYRRARATTGRHLDPVRIERRRHTAMFVGDFLTHLPGVNARQRGLTLRCGEPNYYIDDIPALGFRRIEDIILPEDVLAIEVYDGSSVGPVHYGGHCSVLIWSRHKVAAETR